MLTSASTEKCMVHMRTFEASSQQEFFFFAICEESLHCSFNGWLCFNVNRGKSNNFGSSSVVFLPHSRGLLVPGLSDVWVKLVFNRLWMCTTLWCFFTKLIRTYYEWITPYWTILKWEWWVWEGSFETQGLLQDQISQFGESQSLMCWSHLSLMYDHLLDTNSRYHMPVCTTWSQIKPENRFNISRKRAIANKHGK